MSRKQLNVPPLDTTASLSSGINNAGDNSVFDKRKKLIDHGFTKGMMHELDQARVDCLLHIWILDNSVSTSQADGLRMVSLRDINTKTLVKCTRWDDIMETVLYHAQMAIWVDIPTSFRLLNTVPDVESEFSMACEPYTSEEHAKQDLNRFQQWLMKVQPTGRTPLTTHIYEVRKLVRSITSTIYLKTQHVVLIVATDGFPSNEKGICNDEQNELFRKSLKLLEKLPIRIIFRLYSNHSGLRKVYVFFCFVTVQTQYAISKLFSLTFSSCQ